MPEPLRLTTTLEPRGPAAAIVLTDEQVQALTGGPKVGPVRIRIGERSADGRIGRMGGENLVGLSRARRAELGVEVGQAVEVELTGSTAPPEVEVPADLAAALDEDPALRAAFDGLAPSHRKEFARGVAEAKRPQTREKRVADTLTALREGRTRR